MLVLLLFYFLAVLVWAILSFFAIKALYEFGFVGDASMRVARMYLLVCAIIILAGFLGIILV